MMSAPVQYHRSGFPPGSLDLERLLPLVGPANAALARYDGILSAIPNASVLLTPLTTQEAVLSSRIEGTQATFGEVLQFEAGEESGSEEKKADIYEVLNYRAALSGAIEMLKTLPLSQRLLKNTHQVLMRGVRGEHKAPGEYRKIPNWIGPVGCDIQAARFVPIRADLIPEAMSNWERFLHSDAPDLLIKLAVLHAEFEAIHPFLDGNGRLGRLLIPLYLVESNILSSPNFYISAYLESHRDEYYDRLLAISSNSDWTGWCVFFLNAIIEQAKSNYSKAKAILDLYQETKPWFVELTHSQHAIAALDWFFSRPIFKTTDFVTESKIPRATANRLIQLARTNNLVSVIREASGRRPAVLYYGKLIEIAEGKQIF